MEYTVKQVARESRKYVEKISKTIEKKEKELKEYEAYLDEVDDNKILNIEETQIADKAESLKFSLKDLYKERDELQKCEDFYSNLEELTSNETYDGDLYFDDNLNLRSLGSDPTYELVVDLKSERFYIYRPADTKAVWMTLDEIKALVNKVLDDKQIEEANLISTNSSKFSSKNLAKLSKAVEKVNMERKQFLASALISVKSKYEESECGEI